MRILLVLISTGTAEADIGWGGNLNSHLIASSVRNIDAINYWNLLIMLQVMVINVGDVFSRFLHVLTHISLGFLSRGSAEANIGWGEKLNGCLMASCVRNIHTKNYENLVIFVQVRIENFEDVFWDTEYCWLVLSLCVGGLITEQRRMVSVVGARVTSLTPRPLRTSTRSPVCVTPAHSVEVCFDVVDIADLTKHRPVEVELVRFIRHTRTRPSTAEAPGSPLMVSHVWSVWGCLCVSAICVFSSLIC